MSASFLRGGALGAVFAVTVLALMLAGCSGGGAGRTSSANVATLRVDNFPGYGADSGGSYAGLNSLYVSIRICSHGSSLNCQTIDHIVVDTGSVGLRVLATSLSPPTSAYLGSSDGLLAVVPTIQATSAGSGVSVNGTLAECQQFGGGYAWGSIRNVDVTFVGTSETASNVPMQVMGDMEPAPAACVSDSTTGYALTGVNAATGVANPLIYKYLGANGIIGMSLFAQDCGACVITAEPPHGTGNLPGFTYAVCAGTTGTDCTPTTLALSQQVVNPVALLATDNNGFIVQMAPIDSSSGAPSATGSMIFGIGTQSNNALGSATKFLANPNEEPGFVYATYNSGANRFGIFDSGSSLYFFSDSSIPLCGTSPPLSLIYCPGGANAAPGAAGTTLNLAATVNDYWNDPIPNTTLYFSVTNFNVNLAPTNWAANDVGGPQVFNYFIWGMPAFYGRTLYFGISAASDNYANPYYAF